MNGGQAGNRQLGQVVVIETDDGFISRHIHTALTESGHNTRGENISGSKNAGDFFSGGQLPSQRFALLYGDFLSKDQRGIEGDIVILQRPAVALEALFDNASLPDGGRCEGNGTMAFFQQMTSRDIAAFFIFQTDAAGFRIVHIAINEDIGNTELPDGAEKLILEHTGENQAGQAPAPAEGSQRHGVFHSADHQIVTFRADPLFNAVHKGTHERISYGTACVFRREMRDDPDNVGLIIGKGTGGHTRRIMLTLDDLFNFFDQFGRHAAFPVMNDVGYRSNTYACLRCNILQCDHASVFSEIRNGFRFPAQAGTCVL